MIFNSRICGVCFAPNLLALCLALWLYRRNIIQENLWVDRLVFVLNGEMKMWSGGTASGSCDGDGSACLDGCAFGDKNVRKVAIADGIGTVA